MTDPSRRLYRRFALRMLGLFAILGIVLAIVAVQVYHTIGDLIDANRWVNHTYQTKERIVTTVGALRAVEAAQRAYIISGNAGRLADAYAAMPRLDEHITALHDLVADNAAQGENTARLDALLGQRKALMARSLETYKKGGLQGLLADPQFAVARDQDTQVDQVSARMIALEDSLLAQRQQSSRAAALSSRVQTVSAIVLCFAMLGLALYLILREQRRRVASEARVTASNIELALSLEESRRLGETLHQLSDLGHMLQGCRTLDEAAAGLAAAMGRLFQGTTGSVNLINASQNLIAPIGNWGGSIVGDAVFAPDECWALRLGHAYPETQASTAAFTCKHLRAEPARDPQTRLCVPLLAQGAVLGTLVLVQDEALPAETRAAAVAAAEQISLAIANLRLQETLRTQSLRDPLTGLFNRRYLEVSLARDLTRAIRRNQPLAVLMLDVDHFKRFNDRHGHDAGDALLTQFGELLTGSVRSEDVACRYGGEEFTIVLQEADSALALDRAEDFRQAVRALQVRYRNEALGQVTVSIGIASYPQHGDTPEQLLRRADRALYAAKDGGRDQICVADRS